MGKTPRTIEIGPGQRVETEWDFEREQVLLKIVHRDTQTVGLTAKLNRAQAKTLSESLREMSV